MTNLNTVEPRGSQSMQSPPDLADLEEISRRVLELLHAQPEVVDESLCCLLGNDDSLELFYQHG